jgi:hypothetical protein
MLRNYTAVQRTFQGNSHMYISHTFNDGNKSAGGTGEEKAHFMSRNPQICLRNAESTSLMTAARYIIQLMRCFFFFSKREELMEILLRRPSHSMHMKKCHVSTLTAGSSVWKLKSQPWREGGLNVKAFCRNATGHFIPPIFIFSRAKINSSHV